MKLLVCDDEAGLRKVLKRYAISEGYDVTEAEDGLAAVELCRNQQFDMIIMDVMMPRMDGFSAVKEIRKHADTPILMLTARGEEYDKVLGFELLIDDYVVKPFSSKEIMLRIQAILRRSTNTNRKETQLVGHQIFEKKGLHVDLTSYQVFIDGKIANLAPKEYELLFFLIRNKNIAVSRERILSEVWGYDYCGDDRTLDTHMKLLRRSLGPYGDFITTVRGVGYRLDS